MSTDPGPVDALLCGLERDSAGAFTVQTHRARALSERFRLPAPSYFMLHAVGAAVAAGARQVDVRVRAASFSLSFEGCDLSAADLSDCYAALWSQQRSMARWRELAVACEGARAWGGELLLTPNGLAVHRSGWLPRLRGALGSWGRADDEQLVRDHLVSSPGCAVSVNGQRLPEVELPPLAAAARLGDIGVDCLAPVWEPDVAWLDEELLVGTRGVVGRLLPGHASPAQAGLRRAWPGYLDLIVHARLYRVPLPARWRNCWGVFWLQDLRRDLSLSAIAPAEMKLLTRLVDGCLSAL